MSDKFPMTKHGADLLEKELKKLKNEDRPRIVQAIATAREHGDLKENAEYHAAREEQGFTEGRIKEIEGKLSNAQIIDIAELPQTGKVIFGATVTLVDVEDDSEVKYKIVGDDESDITQGKISYTSPIARALIGKQEGDAVDVKAPKGIVEYEVLAVEYL